MPEDKDTIVARLVIEREYLTQSQLDDALETLRKARDEMGMDMPLLQMLQSKNLLTPDQTQEIRNAASVETGEARLVGDYEVIGKIGAGGMGAVYKAKQARSGEYVALKILPPSLASEDMIARFKRESQMVRDLDHENIVSCVEFGYDPRRKCHFCALELIEGEELGDKITREGVLSETEALSITRQVAMALQHAYFNGLVHRDVKPANIMVTADGTVKLLDLGLARPANAEATRLTQTGMFVGSVYYASPEQAKAESDIDTRSDIYSLGATLYHMVTGKPPFEGGSTAHILYQQAYEKLAWPAELRPELSDGICRVIAKMMAKAPSDRYQTPNDLLEDIDALAEGGEPETDEGALKNSSVNVPAAVRKRVRERRRAGRPSRESGHARQKGHEKHRAPAKAKHDRRKTPDRKKTPVGMIAGGVVVAVIVLGMGVAMLGGKKKQPRKEPNAVARVGGDTLQADGRVGPVPPGPPGEGQPPIDTRTDKKTPTDTEARSAPKALKAARALSNAKRLPTRTPEEIDLAVAVFEKVARDFPGTRQAEDAEIFCVSLGARRGRAAQKQALAGVKRLTTLHVLKGHAREVRSAAFSPDGKRIVSASGDGTVQIWDVESGENILTLPTGSINDTAAFSPDGRLVASGSWERSVCLWDADTGRLVRRLPVVAFPVRCVRFSPDGRTLAAVGEKGSLFIWDTVTWKLEYLKHDHGKIVWTARFSPDGTKLVTGARGEMTRIWDVARRTVVLRLKANYCIFNPDGRTLASGTGLLEAASGQSLLRWPESGRARGFSPDGLRVLISVGDQPTLRVLSARTGETVALLEGHTQYLWDAAFSPDGQRIVTASGDSTVRIWATDTTAPAISRTPAEKSKDPAPTLSLDLGGGVKMDLVLIPAGEFVMGSPESEVGRTRFEKQRRVRIAKSFYMGKYEVTQEQYQRIMGTNPSEFKGPRNPVEMTCWNDAASFSRKLSQLTGKSVRLPMEAEWEYACRAGTTTTFHYGNSLGSDQANFRGNAPYGGAATGVFRMKTTSVGSFAANAWGLHDMHGNVWEWCGVPTGSTAVRRIFRGGAWKLSASVCRSAHSTNTK